MDWSKVSTVCRAHFKQRSYVNQNGEEKFVNDVERFIDYNEDFFDDLPF